MDFNKALESREIKVRSLSDFYGIFTIHTILFTDYDDISDLQTLSSQLDIALNEISPIEYVNSLPTLDEYILMHELHQSLNIILEPQKFTKF